MLRFRLFLPCFGFVMLSLSVRADTTTDPIAKAAAALYDDIRYERLDNGLRVFLKPIPGAATVTTMLTYKVGSADEELDQTGLSHYLEHLMFKGTKTLMPGDIDRLTQRNGGRNNAYTSEDVTAYHFDFAADRWEVALTIEADRMRNLVIDEKHEFEQEKAVVVSELKGGEDTPWEMEQKTILPLLFGKNAPYGHPVIGEAKHVFDATPVVIKAHYDKWYHPNNAVLVVAGGFDPDKALARIKELFGPIPKGLLPPRKKFVPIQREKPIKRTIESKFDVPRLLIGFNTVDLKHPDSHTLDVIEALLSNGKTSRLYRQLVEEARVASEVSSHSSVGRFPGWFSVQVEILKGKDVEQVEQLTLAELRRLAKDGPTEAELKRVRRNLAADLIFSKESVHYLADDIARGVSIADLDYLRNYLPKIEAVTAEDVKRVTRQYLDPNKRVQVLSKPESAKQTGGSPESTPKRRINREDAKGLSGGLDLTRTQRVVLPNGLVLLMLPNKRLPIVAVTALVQEAELHEPAEQIGVAALTGALLDEGAAGRSGPEIARLIEDVGGSLSLTSTGGSLKVLTPDLPLGLELLFDCLGRPEFPQNAFERERERQLSQIDDAEQDPRQRAARAFDAAVYGSHPLGRPSLGTRGSVEKLAVSDCRSYHQKLFLPNNTIVAIVGDIDTAQLPGQIEKLTAKWKKGELPKRERPPIELPKQFQERFITMPSAEQVNVYLGHPGIPRKDPDYYKLLVMDNVLGVGPGFTDRLSASLRDRQGLAYTVSGSITGTAGVEKGTFRCFIGTYPDKYPTARDGFLKEIRRIREEAPSENEVEDAKKYLLGSLPFQTTTTSRVASLLVSLERLGLGWNYLDEYRKAVAAVTPTDVLTVAKKHLHPDRLVIVAAGPINAKGQPLKKPAKAKSAK